MMKSISTEEKSKNGNGTNMTNGNLNGLHVKMVTAVPGKNAAPVVAEDAKYLATSTKCSPVVGELGKGSMIRDVDGNWYVDFTSGIGVTNTGHCHPKVVSAIINQTSQLMHFAGTDFYYKVQVELAKKLTEITPGKHAKKVFYTNSGAESVECGIKVAKWHTKRPQFIGFIGAFHGRTMGANSFMANSIAAIDRYFPMMPGVTKVPYAYCYRCAYKMEYPSCGCYCAKIIDEVYLSKVVPPSETAAFMVEPIQGEGGYIVPPTEFHVTLKKIAQKHGILFIDDEVQAGFGRTGKMFAIEHFGIVPDIVLMAKGMGSGMPIGACVFDAKLDFGIEGAHSNTYGGNLVASAASLATISVIEEEQLLEKATKAGKHMKKVLLEMQKKHPVIGDVRGLGLMQVIEFVKDPKTKEPFHKFKDLVVEESYKNGLLLLPCGSGIRLIPPLNIHDDQLDQGLEILEAAIKSTEGKFGGSFPSKGQ
jgi:4-aminobutyrate aminotransferase